MNYWTSLADNEVLAWRHVWAFTPTVHAVALAVADGEIETNNGRAWPGTNNIGAVQLRSLSAAELIEVQAGRLQAGARFPGNPGGVLHFDSHPGKGNYPVWFATFPTLVEGMVYFLRTLFLYRPKCFAVAMDETKGPEDLALEMYLSGYYEGGHVGARPFSKRTLPLLPSEQANVDDYGKKLRERYDVIRNMLATWSPEGSIDHHGYDLSTISGFQGALKYLGQTLNKPEFDPGKIDGINGPRTIGAVKSFQAYDKLNVDGIVGPRTRAALRLALDA